MMESETRNHLYDVTNDNDGYANGVRNTMIRSGNSGNIKGLAEGDLEIRDFMRCNRRSPDSDQISDDSSSRSSSFASSSSYGDAEVESYGQFVVDPRPMSRKRKAPESAAQESGASERDQGYDTMGTRGKVSGHSDDDDDATVTSQTDDDVITMSSAHRTSAHPSPKEERQRERGDWEESEFVQGLKCSDVQTALRILKTRYRLRDVVKRSASDIDWNMSTNFRPNYGRIGSYCRSKRSLYFASEPLQEMSKKIFIRDLEIEETLRKILAADGETLEPRHRGLSHEEDQSMDEESSRGSYPSQSALRDGPSIKGKHTTFAPDAAHGANGDGGIVAQDDQDGPRRKKPKKNVLQRAARAIRKRITG